MTNKKAPKLSFADKDILVLNRVFLNNKKFGTNKEIIEINKSPAIIFFEITFIFILIKPIITDYTQITRYYLKQFYFFTREFLIPLRSPQ